MQNPELKEVLPYIPYGVQAQDEHGNLRTVTIEHQTYDQNTVGINHVLCNGLFFKRHTLVLRPISDLVKEIEHDGETFVPIVELINLFFEKKPIYILDFCLEYTVYPTLYFKTENHYFKFSIIPQENGRFHISMSHSNAITINDSEPLPCDNLTDVYNYYEIIQKLLEWHFNIFDQQEKQKKKK